jgi:hypothetical protein
MHSNYFHFTTCSRCYTGEEVWLQPTVSTSRNSTSRLRAVRRAAVNPGAVQSHQASIFTRSRAPFPALPFNDSWFIQHLQENSQYRLLLNEQPAINTIYSYHPNNQKPNPARNTGGTPTCKQNCRTFTTNPIRKQRTINKPHIINCTNYRTNPSNPRSSSIIQSYVFAILRTTGH